jgi:hypothetical protein
MKVFSELTLEEFEAWSGAVETKEKILKNEKGDEFDSLIEAEYPEGISETQLNDILWFEDDWLYEMLEINPNEDEEDEEDEEEEEEE